MTSILRKTIYIPYKIIFSYQYVKFSSTASLVKSLRERTGAPMMDCKKALQAEGVDNDISKAIEWLRKKGIARANDKSDRKACEGLIAMKILKDYQTLIEINSETDFVARNHEFQSFVTIVANTVANSITSSNKIENITINDLIHQKPAMIDSPTASITSLSSLNSIQEALGETVSKIRETIIIRRALIVSQDTNEQSVSILGNYVHGKVGLSFIPNDIELGRSAAIVKLSVATTSALSNEVNEMLSDIAKKLAMHVVAAKPLYLQASDVPADVVAKETAIFRYSMHARIH